MDILFTNLEFKNRAGTESYLHEAALGLQARGHRVAVYTPAPGAFAEVLRARGAPVVANPRELPWTPDLIHGHHAAETLAAVQAWPGVPALFLAHAAEGWHDEPPRHPRILRHYAVDEACRERILAAGLPCAGLLANAVDLGRFQPRAPLPPRPVKALVFSNYAQRGNHLEVIRRACRKAGLQLTVVGSGVGRAEARPEAILGDYDLVFAKARCALEAMAVGCAVVLCDFRGLGGLVTRDRVEALRPWNFGFRTLTGPLEERALLAAIAAYDPGEAEAVSHWVRQTADLEVLLDRIEAAHRELVEAGRAAPRPDELECAWLVKLQLRSLGAERRIMDLEGRSVHLRRLRKLLWGGALLGLAALAGLALAGHPAWAGLGLAAEGLLASRVARRWRRLTRRRPS